MKAGLGIAVALAGMVLAGVVVWSRADPGPLDPAEFAARYADPLPAATGPQDTYHLGHSLVGRDMPAMLAQLAGHDHASQLGWGTSLQDHWTGQITGFATENDHAHFRPAAEALASGDYDVVVLTEMVELRDAIRHHDSARNLALWARAARDGNPAVRIYLYETWHALDDPEGWLARIDADMVRHWQDEVLRPAMAYDGVGTIHVIPAGQAMAAVVRAMEAGQVPGLTDRAQLFRRAADGTPDMIHPGDIGAYVVALTHYATLYQRAPTGLPHALRRADGTATEAIPPEAALALQQLVWQVVSRHPLTGLAPEQGGT